MKKIKGTNPKPKKKKYYAVLVKSEIWRAFIHQFYQKIDITKYSGYVVKHAFNRRPSFQEMKVLRVSKDYKMIAITKFDYEVLTDLERRNNLLDVPFPINRIPLEMLNTGDTIQFASDSQLSKMK